VTPTAPVALLDVNVLISLAWPNHVAHEASINWFTSRAAPGWATTPFTETGFVRVSSNRRALPTATTPSLARQLLGSLRQQPGHHFWPDDVTLVTGDHLDLGNVAGHRQVTDAHLLALCARNEGQLVTFDRGLIALAAGRVSVELLTT
jgi:toxin-antitoxin system PIN domain toxin